MSWVCKQIFKLNLNQKLCAEENEERSMIEPGMINNHDYQELLKILINWINDELRLVSILELPI